MALSSKKITEVEQIEKLLNTEDVYVKQGDTFRRIPLSVFFAELWDGRTDNEGTAYPKIGDYIRHIEESLATIKLDDAACKPHDLPYTYDQRQHRELPNPVFVDVHGRYG